MGPFSTRPVSRTVVKPRHQPVYIGVERLAVIAVTLLALTAPEGAACGKSGRLPNFDGLDRPSRLKPA